MKGGNDMVPCTMCGIWLEASGPRKDGLVCCQCKAEETPLLTIEVKDMNSVPIVRYKGKELEGKVSIDYFWLTKGTDAGGHEYRLEFSEGSEDRCSVKTISEKRFGHTPRSKGFEEK